MPTLWQKTTTLCVFENKGALYEHFLARIIHKSVSRDREDGRPTWQPQGVESEAYLNGTSQVSSPEDAREDDHIIRARYTSVFAEALTRQAAQPRKRVPSFAVAAADS
ncbi:MAG: hypothetical protein P8X67_16035 [Syntrophobacterales bacterium]